MPKHAPSLPVPDNVLFEVCEEFLNGKGASEIAKWLAKKHGITRTREQVYPLLSQARKRGYLLLCPPQEKVLREALARKCRRPIEQIQVVKVRGESAREHVAGAAGDLVLTLMKKLRGDGKTTVGVAIGPGTTGLDVSRRLAFHLRSDADAPNLVVHALTAGFAQLEPLAAPVAFFSFFHDAIVSVRHVGLFAPGIMPCKEYEAKVKEVIGLQEAFDEKSNIDIVVTSLGSAKDEHTRFNRLMEKYATTDDIKQRLSEAGYLGDIQYRPFNADGPISDDTGIRPVTLFELKELGEFAKKPGKAVIIVAGPCSECKPTNTKADVLRYLIQKPALSSLWTHLVTDAATALELLE